MSHVAHVAPAAHVPLVEHESATGAVKEQFDQIHAAFGAVPAMFRAVANSPATLASMWGSFGAFAGGTLGAALGEQIAVAVANRNACEYCLSAHTVLGRRAGVSPEALQAAQSGSSEDPRTAALLGFALKLVEHRGQVTAQEVQAVRDQGWGDEHLVEVIGQVALNLFTNYINVALQVPVDFPSVALRRG
ncbi:carboxymuconolactone decarboxylase family protein [Streptomyces sp. TBY4]|uniref:carboxymuconolactone decarboxylase family protein n=1 Tax=Streptomyces sp. TBY4 TaxID=2962030 RepID=UPI0020B736EF|nr:carboxymuconolactone decarboxylase family protein [Streptomyces sp. TBY4]MCP3758013.1 carboxymuconolactone decarboxylase family protein [Streptomyces sp. TBY4]